MEWSNFKNGDIVRWKAFDKEFDFHYGIVVRLEDYSEFSHYEFPLSYPFEETMTGIDAYIPRRYQYVRSITVFSFYEQKTRIIYQSPFDVPYFPELIVYNSEEEPEAEFTAHNED